MRSYKLHAAIVTIACIAMQEVICGRNPDAYIESTEEDAAATAAATAAPVDYPERDCGEYKSQIWDDAFSNPKTMQLAKTVFKTAEDMVADPVCSDTFRALMNYVNELSTNENAQYVTGMFYKLLKTIAKQVTFDESGQAGETKKLMLRVVDSPEVRDLITKSVVRPTELLQDPANRVRMMKIARALFKMFKPSEDEKMVKQTVKNVKGAIANPFKTSKGAIRKLGGLRE